jgi:hypothetical protein
MKFEGFFHIQNFIPQLDGFRAVIFSWFGWNIHRHLWLWKPLAFPRDLCKSLLIFLLFLQLPATTVEIETTAQGNGKDRGFSCDSLMICLMSNHEIFGDSIWFHMIPYESISHRIHGAGIYTNIGGILMGSMLPYIAAPWIRHGYGIVQLTAKKWWNLQRLDAQLTAQSMFRQVLCSAVIKPRVEPVARKVTIGIFQWIVSRENIQETTDFPIKYGAFL